MKEAASAVQAQERIQLLQARVNVKQLQINTSLQVIKLASDAAPLAEHSPVAPEVIAKANETLLAAMDDTFYALPGEEEIAA